MTIQIVWLLDFDGVINASKAGWSAQPFSGSVYANGNSWRIRWSPQLVQRISRVHKLEHVRIMWASSWCGHTSRLEQLIKLPPLLSAASTQMSNGSKLRAAQQVLDDGARLVWTDDEAIPLEWHSTEDKLLIRPRASRGLRPEHLDLIDKFVLGS
jgi:hypothetical protein